jgi:hypothetical protein
MHLSINRPKPEHREALSVGTNSVRQIRQGLPNDVQHSQGELPPPYVERIGQNFWQPYNNVHRFVVPDAVDNLSQHASTASE